MDLMQNVVAGPIQSSPEDLVKQAVSDSLPVVKIQFYRICSYAVHVVDSSGAIAICHILFLLLMTIYATYFKHVKRATRFGVTLMIKKEADMKY